jgi:hypothetical protein
MPFISHVIFDLDDELQQLMKVEEQEALAAAGSSGGKQTGGRKDVNAPGERLRVVRALIALMRHLWSGEHSRPLEPRTLLSALKSDKRLYASSSAIPHCISLAWALFPSCLLFTLVGLLDFLWFGPCMVHACAWVSGNVSASVGGPSISGKEDE